jgi:hypothetical protein
VSRKGRTAGESARVDEQAHSKARRFFAWTAAIAAFFWGMSARVVVADLLPFAPLPGERPLWVNFEILPAEPGKPLPAALRQIESGRLQAEDAVVDGHSYRKTSVVLPLTDGDRREVILLLAEEGGRARMLGFHRIHRHLEAPEGTTIVFESGVPNPLTGVPARVPADTYTYLALCTALASFGPERPPLPAHLWFGNSAVPIDVTFDGKETLDVLGTRVAALRVVVRPRAAAGQATYWFTETSPHIFVQYRGPGDFLAGKDDPATDVVLRATASSEQIRTLFRN